MEGHRRTAAFMPVTAAARKALLAEPPAAARHSCRTAYAPAAVPQTFADAGRCLRAGTARWEGSGADAAKGLAFCGGPAPESPRGSRPISPRDKPSDTASAGRSDERLKTRLAVSLRRYAPRNLPTRLVPAADRFPSLTVTGPPAPPTIISFRAERRNL